MDTLYLCILFAILFVLSELWTIFLYRVYYNKNLQRIIDKYENAVILRENAKHVSNQDRSFLLDVLKSERIYADIHQKADILTDEMSLSSDDWTSIETAILKVYPDFKKRLYSAVDVSDTEYKICMLVKMQMGNAQISRLMHKSKQAITSARSRLYKKTFRKTGSAVEWDAFINSI